MNEYIPNNQEIKHAEHMENTRADIKDESAQYAINQVLEDESIWSLADTEMIKQKIRESFLKIYRQRYRQMVSEEDRKKQVAVDSAIKG